MFILQILSFVFYNWKVFLIGGALAAGLGWLVWERHELIMQGVAQERQQIEDANNVERQKAILAERTVDACFSGGGTWDRALGVCNNPTR